jgi:hypothetical protein
MGAFVQLSETRGKVHCTNAQLPVVVTVRLLGQPVITGAIRSVSQGVGATLRTVMLKRQVDLFPFASVATKLTAVVPIGKQVLLVWLAVMVGTFVQLSRAVGVLKLTRRQVSDVVTVTFCGQFVKTGAIRSVSQGLLYLLTVTVKLHVDLLPLASVAM